MSRLYLVPVEVAARARGPKYFSYTGDPDPPALMNGVNWAMMDFGFEPTALLAADVDAAQHATLAALSDVTVLPVNLDNAVGVNLATVQSELEALNLPANTITAATTYRTVLRGVVSIFRVMKRFKAIRGSLATGRLFPAGITLATTLGELSAQVRADLQQAATELGYDFSGLTLASTLRQVLNKLASQPSGITLLDIVI